MLQDSKLTKADDQSFVVDSSSADERSPADERSSAAKDVIGHRPLPLVIGITGHRDLRGQDRALLAESLRKIFLELRAQYPHTPFLLITALAEGSDRLAADIALEFGSKLVVPMPFRRDLYEADFDTAASREEFDSLLSRSNYSFELPLMEGASEEDIEVHGRARDMQYAQCGAYIALRSQILIAMWNGEFSKLIGGTAQVVQFKLEGVGAPYARAHSPLDVIDSGPVYQIVTPRQSQFNTPDGAYTLKKLYPESLDHVAGHDLEFDAIYSSIDDFNRDALATHDRLHVARETSRRYMLSDDLRSRLSATGAAMLDLYSVADTLSIYYQKYTLRTLKVLLTFVFLAAGFFHVYTHIYHKTDLFLYVYLAIFALAYLWYFLAARKKLQSKYLDYRALAEGLRIQFFWQIAGFDDSVAFYYLRKQKSALDWVRHAVRSSMMSVLTSQDPDQSAQHPGMTHEPSKSGHDRDEMQFLWDDEEERLRHVKKHWVEDQANYFNKAAHREHHRLHGFERIINGTLALGFVLSVIQLFMAPNHVLWVAVGLSAVAAGMLHTYTDKRAFVQHSKQYQRMGNLFNRADLHLDTLLLAREHHEAREFLGELGREALIENGDWILTHRDRPIDVPKGA